MLETGQNWTPREMTDHTDRPTDDLSIRVSINFGANILSPNLVESNIHDFEGQ